ncbi:MULTISPECIES: hypothetical protein [Vibrio diabolicus subgroup]|uniref:hypothetical protein n=1 Tax=Vibrio diabolicus subgroup TaxID=2315253 RepID=UPI00265CF466|nr:hypothetical protein [Vibrio antiquarius]MCS0044658.1 hypothetical protein [Vibrio antiquarius]
MPTINGLDVRTTLLEVVEGKDPKNPESNIQAPEILREAKTRLKIGRDNIQERIVLTEWYELFRVGLMSWGFNFDNPNPPFCHVTSRGQQALELLTRDPFNPTGYMLHIASLGKLNNVAASYLEEGVNCFASNFHKSASVMVGAASEAIILELRDKVIEKLHAKAIPLPKGIDDWRIKTITNALRSFFEQKKKAFENNLKEEYEAYWPAFTQQIRAVRNNAGHPTDISPISADTVHASFLIFPELFVLANKLADWLDTEF